MKRRDYLTGLAGVGALGASGTAAGEDVQLLTNSLAVGDDTHHPGPPRFMQVGEVIVDPVFVNATHGFDRDNLAPSIVGEPQRDGEEYDASDFSWSVKSKPDDSTEDIRYAAEPTEGAGGGDPYDVDDPADGTPRWEPGHQNVAEFIPDVPGTYVLELDAPDGTHEQTIRVFPEAPGGVNEAFHPNNPPRLTLNVVDESGDTFVLEADLAAAPESSATVADLSVEALADDRDDLSTDDITVDGTTITVPKSAVGDSSRIHVCPFDDANGVHGMVDQAVLDGANGTVELTNRPPEWIENGVMYEIFTRSFGGPPESGEWPLENSNANFDDYQDRVSYLSDLGVDVVWLTPVVPSEGPQWRQPEDGIKFLGGGPHGYSALSYFEVAPDLGTEGTAENAMAEYEAFIDACHEQDIKVCFDFVINHCGRHHPFFQDTIADQDEEPPNPDLTYPAVNEWNRSSKYFDWFDRIDAEDRYEEGSNELVEVAPAAKGFFGLRLQPNWDFGNIALREHLLKAGLFWADKGVDAFRCDIAWGVPHSFWREFRDVVKAKDPEIMLLDETIPNRPHFAEGEFDMHFDTGDFMSAAHNVAQGASADSMYDSITVRKDEGFPDHTLLVNATENHDERRALQLAKGGARSDPEKAQRAVWAAGVCLPGVPFVYYGQERQISNYGQERFDFDGTGEDDRVNDGDVGPGNFSRAFMNWGNEFPEEHLQFYKDVLSMYQNTEVLKPEYDLVEAWYETDDDVLVFGRKGDSDMQDAVVIVNPSDSTASVDLLPSVETTDQFTGSDIQSGTSGEAQTVEVDTLAVLRTDSLFSVGSEISVLDEPSGDDNGPGGEDAFTYPTGDAYADGVFDMTEVGAYDGGDTYQFRVGIGGSLENPDGLAAGFSAQHLQFYLRDPSQEGGTSEGRTGTNVTFGENYQYRVVADGANGARVEDGNGNQIATGAIQTNKVDDVIVVEFPKTVLDNPFSDHAFSALMCGYDPNADGNVMQVESEAGTNTFGGARNDNAPNVIDVLAPQNIPQSSLLSYESDITATLQYVELRQPVELTTLPLTDDTGDNKGPGSYTLPTVEEGGFSVADTAYDISEFRVYDNRSVVKFEFEMAAEIQNPFGLSAGFSNEFFQVYIRDTAAGSDAPSGTQGRQGTNIEFEQPYQYRVLAIGEGPNKNFPASVEDPNRNVIDDTVTVLKEDPKTVSLTVPKDAIVSEDVRDLELVPVVCPYDGFNQSGRDATYMRGFTDASPPEYSVGADNPDAAPRVMDMITPPGGQSQSEILDYSSGTPTLSFISLEGGDYRTVTAVSDPEGDNLGAGNLELPTDGSFYPGVYDIREFTLEQNRTRARFTFTMEDLQKVYDVPRGWAHEYFVIYVRDPEAGDDQAATQRGLNGMRANTAKEHHYRILVTPETALRIEDANGRELTSDITTSTDLDENTVEFTVPKRAIGGNVANKEMTVTVAPYYGFASDLLRRFQDDPDEFIIGTSDPGAPKVMDMITPAGTTQTEALSSAGFGTIELPMAVPSNLGGGDSGDGGDGEGPTLPGQSNPAQDPDGDGKFEDVNGDGTTDLFDALDYYNNGDSDAVQNNVDAFDFDGDGDAGDLFDALELWNRIS
jgi:glycosidase/carbohydrate-binding DOMON domain-containing protein